MHELEPIPDKQPVEVPPRSPLLDQHRPVLHSVLEMQTLEFGEMCEGSAQVVESFVDLAHAHRITQRMRIPNSHSDLRFIG